MYKQKYLKYKSKYLNLKIQNGGKKNHTKFPVDPKFIIFAGDHYYPSGGWHDFHSFVDTLEETRKIFEKLSKREWKWVHVLDVTTGKIIYDNWPEQDAQ